jgi:hypothetical protein
VAGAFSAGGRGAVWPCWCPPVRRLVQFGGYFGRHHAGFRRRSGLLKGSVGRVSGTWTTRPREASTPGRQVPTFAPGVVRARMAMVRSGRNAGVAYSWRVRLGRPDRVAVAVFWLSVLAVRSSMSTLAGYPAGTCGVLAKPLSRAGIVGRAPHRAVASACSSRPTTKPGSSKPRFGTRLCARLPAAVEAATSLVASDGSVDGTNEIVRDRSRRSGVSGCSRSPQRRGKIAAINDGMSRRERPRSSCSPTPTRFSSRAPIRALVRELRRPVEMSAPSAATSCSRGSGPRSRGSEDLYYRYERWLQACESRVGTMVGVDGALYAIRRELFVAPPADTILDDMAIPMAVARAGRRVVFEPEARGRTSAAPRFGDGGVRPQVPRGGRGRAVPEPARQRRAQVATPSSSSRWSRTRRCAGCHRSFALAGVRDIRGAGVVFDVVPGHRHWPVACSSPGGSPGASRRCGGCAGRSASRTTSGWCRRRRPLGSCAACWGSSRSPGGASSVRPWRWRDAASRLRRAAWRSARGQARAVRRWEPTGRAPVDAPQPWPGRSCDITRSAVLKATPMRSRRSA